MVKDNQDRETAFRVRNLKDQIKRNNQQYEESLKQAKTEHKNASGGNTHNVKGSSTTGAGAGKHFYSNDPNAYKPHEHFSDYFKKNNIEFDLNKGQNKPPTLNVAEFYKGFARFNSYAWGIAASIGLVAFVSYKMIKKVSDVTHSKKEQEQKH